MKEEGKLDRSFWRNLKDTLKRKKSWTRVEKDAFRPFTEFMSEGDHYSAGLMAETVLSDSPLDFDSIVETSAVKKIEGEEDGGLKDAFALLDSFDFRKRVGDIEEESAYLENDGPDRLIDRVATDLWNSLDGSAKVFFAKYVEEESEALLVPVEGKTPKKGFYRQEASDLYDEILEEDPWDAMNIALRFDLEEEKADIARDIYRRKEAFRKLEENRVSELTSEELSRLESEDLSGYDKGTRFAKDIGNFLTDTYLWRRNPEAAQNAGSEGLVERIKLQQKGRRNGRPSEAERVKIFRDFLENREFHAASRYARAANLDWEDEIEATVTGLLNEKSYREAFAALDSFDYDGSGDRVLEDVDVYSNEGPERLIDRVASDVWRDLDGSARAFFQMYIDDRDERPPGSFREETIARTYIPGSDTPREGDFYILDAFNAYEQAVREDELEEAEKIVERFDTEEFLEDGEN